MSARRRPLSDVERMAALLEILGREALGVGVRAAQLQTDDYNVYVEVRVEKRARPEDNTQYLEAALANLAQRNHWQDSCGESTTKSQHFGSGTKSCSNPISYVVVTDGTLWCRPPLTPLRYRFMCAAHANKARVQDVLAVVLLPKARLDPIRRAVDNREAERRSQERALERGAEGVVDFLREAQADAKRSMWREQAKQKAQP